MDFSFVQTLLFKVVYKLAYQLLCVAHLLSF